MHKAGHMLTSSIYDQLNSIRDVSAGHTMGQELMAPCKTVGAMTFESNKTIDRHFTRDPTGTIVVHWKERR